MFTMPTKISLYHTRVFRTILLDLQQSHPKCIITINRSQDVLDFKCLAADAPPPPHTQPTRKKSAAMAKKKIYDLKSRFQEKIGFIIHLFRHVLQVITKQVFPVNLGFHQIIPIVLFKNLFGISPSNPWPDILCVTQEIHVFIRWPFLSQMMFHMILKESFLLFGNGKGLEPWIVLVFAAKIIPVHLLSYLGNKQISEFIFRFLYILHCKYHPYTPKYPLFFTFLFFFSFLIFSPSSLQYLLNNAFCLLCGTTKININ